MKQLCYLGLALAVVVFFCLEKIRTQGPYANEWEHYGVAHVQFDDVGVPTIRADQWLQAIEAQGYVTASQRMWQMDLFRRSAGGRLAEWFGVKAVEHDRARRFEDWSGVAARAEELLPIEEKRVCDAYARGVNDFIIHHQDHWGVEYSILRVVPESWTCADSLLVEMNMFEELSSRSEKEWGQWEWKRHLSPGWQGLIFPDAHIWNHPLFPPAASSGLDPEAGKPKLPPRNEYLPHATLQSKSTAANFNALDPVTIGSNSWAYRGDRGAFLANDPHLAHHVPQLWFAVRLLLTKNEWVVGVSIPGLPGVVLGMNPSLAWAFTNTGEDVDDYVEEKVSPDGTKYWDGSEGGRWLPLTHKPFGIKVKGQADSTGDARFTRRGPLKSKFDEAGKEHLVSRQWLALDPSMVRLSTLAIDTARNWVQFNDAFDGMRLPSQNVLFMDRAGNMGYRASGIGIVRKVSGRTLQPADVGQWLGYEQLSERRRFFTPATERTVHSLATANQRIWVDHFGHGWYGDERVRRIDELLRPEHLAQKDMAAIQEDTRSEYFRLLLRWVAQNADRKSAAPVAAWDDWMKWDGDARSNAELFTAAIEADKEMLRVLIERVRARAFKAGETPVDYFSELKSGWLIYLISTPNSFEAFGTSDHEMADYLAAHLARQKRELYYRNNRFEAQHPFVAGIPVLGRLFAVDSPEQIGWPGVPRVERPLAGASTRMIWNLSHPEDSEWIFPVGQSEHVWSKHYRDMQPLWFAGTRLKVFGESERGEFGF